MQYTYKELYLKNIGLYKNDVVIPLNQNLSESRNIVLSGGLNGAGKSTQMSALKIVLNGQDANCFGQQSYHGFIHDYMNTRSRLDGIKTCEIGLSIIVESGKGKADDLVIKRIYTVHSPTIVDEEVLIYYKETPRLVDSSLEEKNNFLNKIFPPKIMERFLFDADAQSKLADDKNNVELIKSFGDILNINGYIGVEKSLENLEKQILGEVADVEKSDVMILYGQIIRCEEKREKQKKELAEYERELKALDIELDHLNKWCKEVGEHSEYERLNLEQELLDCEKEKESILLSLDEYMMESIPFLLMEPLLEDASKQLIAEKDYLLQKQYQTEDKSKLERVIEVLSDEEIRSFLTEEQSTLIEIKQRSAWCCEMSGVEVAEMPIYHHYALSQLEMERLNNTLSELSRKLDSNSIAATEKVEQFMKLSKKADECQHKLKALPSDQQLGDRYLKRRQLVELREGLNRHIESAFQMIHTLEAEHTELVKTHKEMKLRLSDKQLVERKVYLSSTVRAILRDFVDVLRKEKAKEVIESFQDMFVTLLRKEGYVHNFKIDSQTFGVSFEDNLGNVVNVEKLSNGEKQIYATAMNYALGKAALHDYPVAIDTPTARFDSHHIRNVVEHYFPRAGNQVLLYSTDEEITVARKGMIQHHIATEYLLNVEPNNYEVKITNGYFS
ncbi:DNA sulfur modification protein DndD [Priestia megaterium]